MKPTLLILAAGMGSRYGDSAALGSAEGHDELAGIGWAADGPAEQ